MVVFAPLPVVLPVLLPVVLPVLPPLLLAAFALLLSLLSLESVATEEEDAAAAEAEVEDAML